LGVTATVWALERGVRGRGQRLEILESKRR